MVANKDESARSMGGRRLLCGLLCMVIFDGSMCAAFAWETNDWDFLDTIERANLRFFENERYGPYNNVVDNAEYRGGRYSDLTSVAGTGFELTALCLGHYRGWISYSNAYEQVLGQLQAYSGVLSTNPEVFKRENGWTYHWYNIWTGEEASPDGLSLLDHSLFIAGCIFAGEYFKGTEAGKLAEQLYADTTWSWRPNSDYDFGYSENLLAVVESAAAPQWAKGAEAKVMWDSYTIPWPRMLQLYFWQYPHCWIDFRFRADDRGYNHADVARDSILYQRQRAMDLHAGDPGRYDMLGSNVWGWTAAIASDGYRQMAPWGFWLGGEWMSEEKASDSGSVTPFALPPCMIYAPTETMAAMKHIYETYYVNGWNPALGDLPVWSDMYGFLNCFNKGVPWVSAKSNYFWGVNAAIDYGPNVLMLENFKMGTTWRYFMQNPYISAGMYTVGFGDPSRITCATFSNAVNAFGGGLGHWENDGTPVSISYVTVADYNEYVGNGAVRIVADHADEGGWIELNGADQRSLAQLSFWIRGTGAEEITVGLKDMHGIENKVALADYIGAPMPTNWTLARMPLEVFCHTGISTNDTWPGWLSLVSFAFENDAGGSIDIDGLAFEADTLAPSVPTNSFGVAMAGQHARVCWDPAAGELDLVGYHIWRRTDATSGFTRVSGSVIPAYLGVWEDTSLVARADQELRYAIQAFDNAEPANSSLFTDEKKAWGGKLDVDWNNGRNPNVLGGSGDGYWGACASAPEFRWGTQPNGQAGWYRRLSSAGSGGQYIDMADADLGDYSVLQLFIRGAAGGEQVTLGLRDSSDAEHVIALGVYLASGVETNWLPVVVPLSDFTNVNISALRNIAFVFDAACQVDVAGLSFCFDQRFTLNASCRTEAEHYTRQHGSSQKDYKDAASNGEVLGWGWATFGGDYAEYAFYLDQPLTTPELHVRYAAGAGDGRALDVRWDGVTLGAFTCEYSGGWGETSNEFRWATFGMPTLTTGYHTLTFYAAAYDEPINLDYWYFSPTDHVFHECEDYVAQTGSTTQDFKAGASAGEVLGQNWGVATNSEAVYSVKAGAHSNAWIHLWYARAAADGGVLDVFMDDHRMARLICPPTRGWGDRAGDFDRASACLGNLSASPHTLRLAVPHGGAALNLDCFYLGDKGPGAFAQDSDGDGLSDRQEETAGTDSGVLDSDGDGIPDGDELQHARSGAVSDPALPDTDGDGHNDYQERIAGTDPCDPASLFAFDAMGKDAGEGFDLAWPTVSGRIYRLYYTDGPFTNNAHFQEIPDPENIIIENETAGYHDPRHAATRYYRIHAETN
ncbi:MAG: carbohydrate-binding protein [Spartobacteria bacterium]|nr:carbohydrate-binding protein [Spartobacteria bacterium]